MSGLRPGLGLSHSYNAITQTKYKLAPKFQANPSSTDHRSWIFVYWVLYRKWAGRGRRIILTIGKSRGLRRVSFSSSGAIHTTWVLRSRRESNHEADDEDDELAEAKGNCFLQLDQPLQEGGTLPSVERQLDAISLVSFLQLLLWVRVWASRLSRSWAAAKPITTDTVYRAGQAKANRLTQKLDASASPSTCLLFLSVSPLYPRFVLDFLTLFSHLLIYRLFVVIF